MIVRSPTPNVLTGQTVKIALAVGLAVPFLFPLAWALVGSVYSQRADGTTGLTSEHYERLLTYGQGLGTYVTNSLTVVALTVSGTVMVSLLGGYAFARFRFPGRNLLFLGTLAILMVPHATILIPLYVLLAKVGMTDSLVGLSLVLIMYQLPFSLFMMRNSFEAVPRELDDAALVDGCSSFQVLTKVLLPAVVPGTITVGLFALLTAWNEFISALILISNGKNYTLPVALVSLQQGDWGSIDYGALQAGVVVSALPCIVLFFALQRAYMSGFTTGAIKG